MDLVAQCYAVALSGGARQGALMSWVEYWVDAMQIADQNNWYEARRNACHHLHAFLAHERK